MTERTPDRNAVQPPVRILIVDDHALVRDGIRARLATRPELEVVGEGGDGTGAAELAAELVPDLVMLDISMPGISGLDAIEPIRRASPATKILMLSMYDNPEYVRRAVQNGAHGYILKDVSITEMINAVTSVAAGGLYFSPKAGQSLMQPPADEPGDNRYGLTSRETEILIAIADGLSNKEIASAFKISVRTVESHRQNIRDKVGGGNAAHLARIAGELGLLTGLPKA